MAKTVHRDPENGFFSREIPNGRTIPPWRGGDDSLHEIVHPGDSIAILNGRRVRKMTDEILALVTKVDETEDWDVLQAIKQSFLATIQNFRDFVTTLTSTEQKKMIRALADKDSEFWDVPIEYIDEKGHLRTMERQEFTLQRFHDLPDSGTVLITRAGEQIEHPVTAREDVILCLLTKSKVNARSILTMSHKRLNIPHPRNPAPHLKAGIILLPHISDPSNSPE